jgi:ribosomal protein L14E/L6E/L27E
VNILDNDCHIGRLVVSKAGRDAGELFVIIGILDEKYVFISNGNHRSIEKPKKKKIKHLEYTEVIAEQIRDTIISNKKLTNSMVKKFLGSHQANKEV